MKSKDNINSHLMKGIMEINVLDLWAPEARARAKNTSWQFHMVNMITCVDASHATGFCKHLGQTSENLTH